MRASTVQTTADNCTQITFTQGAHSLAWEILVQVAQGAHRQSRGLAWDILWHLQPLKRPSRTSA
ncbi:BQ5605_C035g11410 [Microbotryum silenes-dioicae]|uniref:BQ5605_C035g11410 protein n=1 Tax=Microbotryum silenes-dioicae TaxID=796604 RepID=A0A2X0N9B2_9BASI|nr:BQ5605_C035g11410 [Microbotryum silenes-dioicae]